MSEKIKDQLAESVFAILDVRGPDGELKAFIEGGGRVNLTLDVTLNSVWSDHDGTSREYDLEIVEVRSIAVVPPK